jgi:hypothetical protein
MIARLRELSERPLDPSAARAVLALAASIFLGFGLLVLAAGEEQPARPVPGQGIHLAASLPSPTAGPRPAPAHLGSARRRQDPQDRKGSAAARRAAQAIRAHRVLQHLPYRDGRFRVELIGARGPRAVLRVTAPSVRAARLGWRRFLRRYRDGGSAYLPLFDEGRGGSDG